MGFNAAEYMNAFETLVIESARMIDLDSADVEEAFEEVCETINIAYAEAVINTASKKDADDNGMHNIVFYNGGEDFNRKNPVSLNEVMGEYSVICSVYPTSDAVWSPEIREKLDILLQIMLGLTARFYEKETYKKLAFSDRQLGVYNMEYFTRVTRRLIARKVITDYTACAFNLKGFSLINNKIGRDAGTAVMKEYAAALEKKIEKTGWVFRVSGDSFITLFRNDRLDTVMEHLKGEKVYIEEDRNGIFLSAHAGYYKIDTQSCTGGDIIDKINAALVDAKTVTKAQYTFYNEEIHRKIRESKQIERLFPDAIANEEFLVYYQPKTQLKNYRLYGAEALCRWEHDGEIVPPYRFIPLLENSRDICRLDFYMLEHVCRDIRRWLDEGKEVVKVSVNFSRYHLGDMNLLENILNIIDGNSVPHKYIEIELTETATEVDFEELKRIVSELRKKEISVSVDDFGIGYSSLNLIRDIPWSVLKIDKCFLPETNDSDDEKKKKKIMLKSVIDMSQALGLECITEGVETLDQIKLLKKNNCFVAQGYYFDKPLPVDEFEKRLL